MNDAVYDTIRPRSTVPWFGFKPAWYRPQPGTSIGWGIGYSQVFCFACHSWNIRQCGCDDWPEAIECDNCEQIILTRKPEG